MSDGAKESRDGAQLAVVVVLLSFNFSLCLLSSIKNSPVDLCIPLPGIVGQSLVSRGIMAGILFI